MIKSLRLEKYVIYLAFERKHDSCPDCEVIKDRQVGDNKDGPIESGKSLMLLLDYYNEALNSEPLYIDHVKSVVLCLFRVRGNGGGISMTAKYQVTRDS